jgi:hypothetical protein
LYSVDVSRADRVLTQAQLNLSIKIQKQSHRVARQQRCGWVWRVSCLSWGYLIKLNTNRTFWLATAGLARLNWVRHCRLYDEDVAEIEEVLQWQAGLMNSETAIELWLNGVNQAEIRGS